MSAGQGQGSTQGAPSEILEPRRLLSALPRFKKVSEADGLHVIRHMLLSSYPAGREWEPINEQQIYFIKEGACEC